MKRDVRDDDLYKEAEVLCRVSRRPGSGKISDAQELVVSPHGKWAAFAGAVVESLVGSPPTRICLTEMASGETRVLTSGPNNDRSPQFLHDGKRIAFLSDRARAGDFQLHFLDIDSGFVEPGPRVEGFVEYLSLSPDGQQLLLGVAGYGADLAGAQGAIPSAELAIAQASWMPRISGAESRHLWRKVWLCEVTMQTATEIPTSDLNIWEASWCGAHRIGAVASTEPGEGAWYNAKVYLIDVATGAAKLVHDPIQQPGVPRASGSGKHLAFIEAVCSDRVLVAGDLRILDIGTMSVKSIATDGVDVASVAWCSETSVLVAGHRGFESVILLCDVERGSVREVWKSDELSGTGSYLAASPVGTTGVCAVLTEGFARAPELAVIRDGAYHIVCSFDLGLSAAIQELVAVEQVFWNAPDGLQIQGWLLKPKGPGPYPTVVNIHGGPVWLWRPIWLGRASMALLMLVRRGVAVFLPNPRGSAGRGQWYAGQVKGDMGGAECADVLTGLDHLVAVGAADSRHLGITGGSYGGFLSAWLTTQDSRFRAAVPVAPFTNHVTEHLISNIPDFVRLFLGDEFTDVRGKYFQRSPIFHAHKSKTPTLNVCGALDRSAPPEEAVQYHAALREVGTPSVLVTYPEEGHGIRKWPATIDLAARVVGWFETHL